MVERRSSGEQRPEQKKKIYPSFVGDDLVRRRFFDIGVESCAEMHTDVGDEVDKEVLTKSWLRFDLASKFLTQDSNQEVNLVANQMKEEAHRRGLIPEVATFLGIMPFSEDLSVDSVFEYMSSRFMSQLRSLVADEVKKELKEPRYPDVLEDSRIGRRIFDRGVRAVEAGINYPRNGKVWTEESSRASDLLARIFPESNPNQKNADSDEQRTTFWKRHMTAEAFTRGHIAMEKYNDRRMDEELKKLLDEEKGD